MIGGKVLDSTAVLAIAAGTSDYTDALMVVANQLGITLAVPTTAFQTAWQVVAARDGPWLEQLPAASMIVMLDLDTATAREAGQMAAHAGRPAAHLAAAHAAQIGVTRGWPVVTRSPQTLLVLSRDVITETIP